MIHALKQLPGYFEDVLSGRKTFEVRENDRLYQVGDLLALNEYTGDYYTGRSCLVKVDYILDNEQFCKEGFVVMAIKLCSICVNDGEDPRFCRSPFAVPLATGDSRK